MYGAFNMQDSTANQLLYFDTKRDAHLLHLVSVQQTPFDDDCYLHQEHGARTHKHRARERESVHSTIAVTP